MTGSRAPRTAVLLLSLLAGGAAAAAASGWLVDPQRTRCAALVHRAGVGARLAHDHLIVARGVEPVLAFDPERPEAGTLRLAANVLALEVDPPGERKEWSQRLIELGALAETLPPIDDEDREKVRKAMLGRSQLDAESFPAVVVEVLGLERRDGEGGAGARVALAWDARVRVRLHGKTVERQVPVRWEVANGELIAEGLGEFRFTEFGIRPYSAVLGAIRNADLFHLYLHLVARPAPNPG